MRRTFAGKPYYQGNGYELRPTSDNVEVVDSKGLTIPPVWENKWRPLILDQDAQGVWYIVVMSYLGCDELSSFPYSLYKVNNCLLPYPYPHVYPLLRKIRLFILSGILFCALFRIRQTDGRVLLIFRKSIRVLKARKGYLWQQQRMRVDQPFPRKAYGTATSHVS